MELFFYAYCQMMAITEKADWTTGLVEANSLKEAMNIVDHIIVDTQSTTEVQWNFFALPLSKYSINVMALRQACNAASESNPILQPFFYIPHNYAEADKHTILVHGKNSEGAVYDAKARIQKEMTLRGAEGLTHGEVVPIISQHITYHHRRNITRGATATLVVLYQ